MYACKPSKPKASQSYQTLGKQFVIFVLLVLTGVGVVVGSFIFGTIR